jgi:hypothetical protein
MEGTTQEFDRIKRDYRLVIKPHEFQCCMHNAQVLMEQQHGMLPHGFWQQLGHYRSCENGVIYETAHSDVDSWDETFLGGAFSQDISLSQEVSTSVNSVVEDSASSVQRLASMQMVHQNSNLYDSSLSQVKGVLNTCHTCNDPELESFWTTELSVLIGRFQDLVVEKFGHDSNFTGECVSLSVPVDRRQKYKRIKSKSEPPRKTMQRLYKGERTTVQLSNASLMTTGDKQH